MWRRKKDTRQTPKRLYPQTMIKNEDTYCTVQHRIVRELGAWEAVIYATIANLLRKTDGIGEVSNQTLIELCGVNKKSLSRYIATLIESGYVEKKAGDGRGNISIYYVTKKGDNLTPFNTKKGGQNDPKRGTNLPLKGDKMTPINKGENKEKKESGGDTRVPVDVPATTPTLSDTTPQIFEDMKDFEEFWVLYPEAEKFAHEKENCERVWYAMPQEWRDKLVQQLRNGQRWRKATGTDRDNPIWYLRNYSGQDAKMDPATLPFVRQGTAAFIEWIDRAQASGEKVVVMRYPDERGEIRLAYCLARDKQTMLNAGAEYVRDFN